MNASQFAIASTRSRLISGNRYGESLAAAPPIGCSRHHRRGFIKRLFCLLAYLKHSSPKLATEDLTATMKALLEKTGSVEGSCLPHLQLWLVVKRLHDSATCCVSSSLGWKLSWPAETIDQSEWRTHGPPSSSRDFHREVTTSVSLSKRLSNKRATTGCCSRSSW